jgi:hypothetical protein
MDRFKKMHGEPPPYTEGDYFNTPNAPVEPVVNRTYTYKTYTLANYKFTGDYSNIDKKHNPDAYEDIAEIHVFLKTYYSDNPFVGSLATRKSRFYRVIRINYHDPSSLLSKMQKGYMYDIVFHLIWTYTKNKGIAQLEVDSVTESKSPSYTY